MYLVPRSPVLFDQVGDHVLPVAVHSARNRQEQHLKWVRIGSYWLILSARNPMLLAVDRTQFYSRIGRPWVDTRVRAAAGFASAIGVAAKAPARECPRSLPHRGSTAQRLARSHGSQSPDLSRGLERGASFGRARWQGLPLQARSVERRHWGKELLAPRAPLPAWARAAIRTGPGPARAGAPHPR